MEPERQLFGKKIFVIFNGTSIKLSQLLHDIKICLEQSFQEESVVRKP
jgi:hypothetical protein